MNTILNKTSLFFLLTGVIAFSVFGCEQDAPASGETNAETTQTSKLTIVATTSILADGIRNIVGEHAEVQMLMGADVDPHVYQATQSDLGKLANADIIVYSGLKLEGKMEDIFRKLASKKPVIEAAKGLDAGKLIPSDDYENAFDPHFWFDVAMFQDAMTHIGYQLAKIDTANAENYQSNLELYLEELRDLQSEVTQAMGDLPESAHLITTHDAFAYLSAAYGIPVKGLQGISTEDEISIKDVTDLIDFIIQQDIRSVFVESSSNDKSILAVIDGCQEKGHDVKLGGSLYADALGPKGSEAETYVTMVQYNLRKIVFGLTNDHTSR